MSLLVLVIIVVGLAYGFLAGYMGSWPQIIRKMSGQKYDDCDEYQYDKKQLPKIKDLEDTGVLHIVVGLNTTSKDKSFLSKHHKNKSKKSQIRILLNHWTGETERELGCSGSGGSVWDGKPWVYNGNNQHVKDMLAIINKWIKTRPKPKTCEEVSKNMNGYFTEISALTQSESFPQSESAEMGEIGWILATTIDPSWKNKYTKDNAPQNFPTTPETEFYGLNKTDGMSGLYLDELDCKYSNIYGSAIIPKSTDAQVTAARELLTTIKKIDANNVNCADALLTFAMMRTLGDQPGVGEDHPDLAWASWASDIIPVHQRCEDVET